MIFLDILNTVQYILYDEKQLISEIFCCYVVSEIWRLCHEIPVDFIEETVHAISSRCIIGIGYLQGFKHFPPVWDLFLYLVFRISFLEFNLLLKRISYTDESRSAGCHANVGASINGIIFLSLSSSLFFHHFSLIRGYPRVLIF